MIERALAFGDDRSLAGVVTDPGPAAETDALPAVIFLNSGLMHRVGPNRLYVRLARRLAEQGFRSLRFDLSGIGDSRAARDRLSIRERWVAETRSAMDVLAAENGAASFVLIGNCSGAAASFLTAHEDVRVVGLGLINLQGRKVLRHYLRLVTASPVSWRRLLHGRAKVPTLRFLSRQVVGGSGRRQPPSFVRGLTSLAQRGVYLLLVNSEWDSGYDYFHRKHRPAFDGAPLAGRVVMDVVPGANHDLGLVANQDRLVSSVDRWMSCLRDTVWRSPASDPRRFVQAVK